MDDLNPGLFSANSYVESVLRPDLATDVADAALFIKNANSSSIGGSAAAPATPPLTYASPAYFTSSSYSATASAVVAYVSSVNPELRTPRSVHAAHTRC
jgi:hypothetical protein